MKITAVEALPLSIPYHIGEGRGGRIGNGSRLDFCLVRVETDAGLVGWGEAFSYHCRSAVVAAVRDMIAPRAMGHDPLKRDELIFSIQKQLHIFGRMGIQCYALSGLDIALWDLAGKAAGKPLHAMIDEKRGGAARTLLPCYASLLRYTDPALVAQYAAHAREQGFEAVKLHEVTEPAVRAARAALGEDVPLMVDVNCEWDERAAIAAAKSFAPHRLSWLEEPVFPPEDFRSMAAVGKASGIPIASGENLCYATQFAAMREAGAVALAQPSVTKVGGVSEFLKVARSGARLAPHSPYFGPGAVATLHLIAALAPEARFELFYLWAEATLYPGLFGKPQVAVPDKPGLGVDPDPEVIRRYRA